MKVSIMGVTGEVLRMEAMTESVVQHGAICYCSIICYEVTIMESPGKEITFKGVASDEIKPC